MTQTDESLEMEETLQKVAGTRNEFNEPLDWAEGTLTLFYYFLLLDLFANLLILIVVKAVNQRNAQTVISSVTTVTR